MVWLPWFWLLLVLLIPVTGQDKHYMGGSISFTSGDGNIFRLTVVTGWKLGEGPCGRSCDEQKIGTNTSVTRRQMKRDHGKSYFGMWEVSVAAATFNEFLKGMSSYTSAVNKAGLWEQEVMETDVLLGVLEHEEIRLSGLYWRPFNYKYVENASSVLQVDLIPLTRNDTGLPNNSPIVMFKPLYRISLNKTTRIVLSTMDKDDDFVRCDVSPSTMTAVKTMPKTTVSKDCSFTVEAYESYGFTDKGYGVVTLLARDFNKHILSFGKETRGMGDTRPLSTVLVQFMVETVKNDEKPSFLPPTRDSQHVFVVYTGSVLEIPLYAMAGKLGEFHARSLPSRKFHVALPTNVTQHGILKYLTKVTWKPAVTDVGLYMVSASVVNSMGRDGTDRNYKIIVKESVRQRLPRKQSSKIYFKETVKLPIECLQHATCSVFVSIATEPEGRDPVLNVTETQVSTAEVQIGPPLKIQESYTSYISLTSKNLGNTTVCLKATGLRGVQSEELCLVFSISPKEISTSSTTATPKPTTNTTPTTTTPSRMSTTQIITTATPTNQTTTTTETTIRGTTTASTSSTKFTTPTTTTPTTTVASTTSTTDTLTRTTSTTTPAMTTTTPTITTTTMISTTTTPTSTTTPTTTTTTATTPTTTSQTPPTTTTTMTTTTTTTLPSTTTTATTTTPTTTKLPTKTTNKPITTTTSTTTITISSATTSTPTTTSTKSTGTFYTTHTKTHLSALSVASTTLATKTSTRTTSTSTPAMTTTTPTTTTTTMITTPTTPTSTTTPTTTTTTATTPTTTTTTATTPTTTSQIPPITTSTTTMTTTTTTALPSTTTTAATTFITTTTTTSTQTTTKLPTKTTNKPKTKTTSTTITISSTTTSTPTTTTTKSTGTFYTTHTKTQLSVGMHHSATTTQIDPAFYHSATSTSGFPSCSDVLNPHPSRQCICLSRNQLIECPSRKVGTLNSQKKDGFGSTSVVVPVLGCVAGLTAGVIAIFVIKRFCCPCSKKNKVSTDSLESLKQEDEERYVESKPRRHHHQRKRNTPENSRKFDQQRR